MRRLTLAITLVIAAVSGSAGAASNYKLAPQKAALDTPLTPRERAAQLLNRFTFGPRPGDLDHVLATGTDQWFAAQLNPASIPDVVLEHRLEDYPTLALTPAQALLRFPDRGMIKQIADGKRPMPPETASDPLLLSVYQVQLYKLQQEQDAKRNAKPESADADKAAQKQLDQAAAVRIAGQLFALPKQDRMAALDALPPADRIVFADNIRGDQKNILLADFTPRERETITSFRGGLGLQHHIVEELAQARELRNILSERQLQEVMTDFWFNHFNVFAPKESDQWYITSYERDAIRPNALGHFRDLLLATAESPAMMVYLDNWLRSARTRSRTASIRRS